MAAQHNIVAQFNKPCCYTPASLCVAYDSDFHEISFETMGFLLLRFLAALCGFL